LRNAITFSDCGLGLLVAARDSKAGDTFQRCPSSVTRLIDNAMVEVDELGFGKPVDINLHGHLYSRDREPESSGSTNG
jgi:hypothetical protein